MTGAELAGVLAELGAHPAWVLVGILLATFILEDAATVAAGLLAAQGLVDPALAVAVLCAGTGAGDIGLHLAGRWARRHRWVDRQCARPAVARAADWLTRRRWPALLLARFVPGLRLPTYLASGLLRLPLAGCAIVIAAATVLWTPGLFLLGMAGWTVVSSVNAELGLALAVVTLLAFSCIRLCRWERRQRRRRGRPDRDHSFPTGTEQPRRRGSRADDASGDRCACHRDSRIVPGRQLDPISRTGRRSGGARTGLVKSNWRLSRRRFRRHRLHPSPAAGKLGQKDTQAFRTEGSFPMAAVSAPAGPVGEGRNARTGASMKLFLLPMLALLGAASAPAPAPAPAAKWKSIFDGKTLAGWTPKITGRAVGEDPLHMFTVQDGAIRVSHANYKKFEGEFGHLFWKTPLKAYRLRFEYRLFGDPLPGIQVWQTSNSGLMFHSQAPETMRRDQAFPVSLEMQLLGIPRPKQEPTGNLCTPGTTVAIDGKRDLRHCILSTSGLLPVGSWTKAALEVLPNGEITHFINGKPVLHYSAPELDPKDKDAQPLIAAAGGAVQLHQGYIALQSEGHQIEFRKIELQLLD